MSGRYYWVRMKLGTTEKNQKIYATSETNAKFEAQKQNPKHTVVDVRVA